MQFYLNSIKSSKVKTPVPKIVYYFANCAQGRFNNSRVCGSGDARYYFEMIFSKYILFSTPLQF